VLNAIAAGDLAGIASDDKSLSIAWFAGTGVPALSDGKYFIKRGGKRPGGRQ
jgi:hypothetical protein